MHEAVELKARTASPRRIAVETHRQAQQVLSHLGLLAMETVCSEDAARHLLKQFGSLEAALDFLNTSEAGLKGVLASWALEARHQDARSSATA